MSENEKHNFSLKKDQTFVPSRCRRAIDSSSKEPFNVKNQIIGESSTVEDMCFVFEPFTVSAGCSDKVLDDLWIETQPALPQELMSQVTQSYDGRDFTVCIPKAMINDTRMPKNKPINWVFTVFFDEFNGLQSTTSIVYEATFLPEIRAILNFNQQVTDIDTGDAVVISAATSRFIDYGDRELSGLTYRWECESAFAAICADFNGSPTLSIPNAELETYASLDRFYKFKVIVSAIEAGSELVSEFSA